MDVTEVITAVAPRLRALRRRRELTLATVSAATGISESTLSRLESGGRRPTLELLLPLARIYQVAIDEIIGAPPTGDPRVNLTAITRYGMLWLPLTRRPGGLQAYKIVIPAGPRTDVPTPKSNERYEWLYILNGRLRLILGEQDLILSPGEAAEFDTHTPHWFTGADTAAVEILILLGTQGERTHLRATPRKRRDTDTSL